MSGGPRPEPIGRAVVVRPLVEAGRQREGQGPVDAAEAAGLAEAIGLEVVFAEAVPLRRRRPATLLGQGTVERLAAVAEESDATVIIVDAPLTPVQQRNLERATKAKVIDRTGLILEIFGARARTHEGRLQVELASLSYQRSRLVRSWTHLERQRGGYGFLGGPGESQIEIDRRLIDERIAKIRRELDGVRRTRALHRDARRRVPYPVVALVGYTNAGKSTLFNRLTGASVLAKDMLFATLDPTMRRLHLPSGRNVILSDTVGFISDLPTQLVAAFRATLEEVAEADLIVHVRDISHPDTESQRDDVRAVLTELDLEHRPTVEVLNKIDLLEPAERDAVVERAKRTPDVAAVSAVDGTGCDALLATVERALLSGRRMFELAVDVTDGQAIAWLYAHGEVVGRHDDERTARLAVMLDPTDADRFSRRFADGAAGNPAGG